MNDFTVAGYVSDSNISVDEFNKNVLKDRIVKKVPGDGNCLFHSLAYLLNKQFPKKKITYNTIRNDICNYYERTFGSRRSLDPVSEGLDILERGSKIEQLLFQKYTQGIPRENGHFELPNETIIHQIEVCNDETWGSDNDITIACILYDINVVVFNFVPPYLENPKGQYLISTHKNDDSYPTFLLKLKMERSAHYEPIYDKSSKHVSKKLSPQSKKSIGKSDTKSKSNEKHTTRKMRKKLILDRLNILSDKIGKFNGKIGAIVRSSKRAEVEDEMFDIHTDIGMIISELEPTSPESVNSKVSEKYSESPNTKKIIEDEILSYKEMLKDASKSEKSYIKKQINQLEIQLKSKL